jgi:2-dehydropantoate 2-reductase
MHTGAAMAAVAPALAGGATCSVQNGVGNEEAIAEHVERVIRGTTFPAGRILEPGHVQWDVKGDTTIGPFEPSPAAMDEVERLADACTRGGLPTQAVGDARGPQWRQVIFNAATNPVGALTGLTHGQVCEKPEDAYWHKASMLQDAEARRTTEIVYLNGGIVRFGRELGVPTPLNEAVTALIKGMERAWQL